MLILMALKWLLVLIQSIYQQRDLKFSQILKGEKTAKVPGLRITFAPTTAG